MKISIALASYNGEKYIQEQLDSFVQQTRQPDELVVSDDGSGDGTLDIVEAFRESAPFEVRVLRDQENLGYAGNFNRALSATTGDLVFLSDQDDVWFPEKLERMERAARDDPDALLIMCDAALTDGALNPVGVTKIGQFRSGGIPITSFVMGCCAAVKRELLDMVLPIPPGFPSHDGWLVRIADGIGCKAVHDEPLQYYRRHESNVSGVIVNRASRISKWQLFQERMKKTFARDSMEGVPFDQQICKNEQMIVGVRRAMERTDSKWYDALRALVGRMESQVEAARERSEIRRTSFLRRMPRVVGFWWRGGYRQFRGWRSAVRDLAFK
jgi:glycosyltransferase involved in cell wall biosynthesis